MPRTSSSASPRDRIFTYLQQHGGRVESPDGLGLTSEMAAATGYTQVAALNAMLVRLESEGLITRQVRGKRTLAVSLGSRRGSAKGSTAKAPTAAKATAGRRGGRKAAPRKATAARKTAGRAGGRSAGGNVSTELAALSRDI